MENIYYFFRNNATKSNFVAFGPWHLLLLFIALIGTLFLFKYKLPNKNLELFIGYILIFQQVILFAWYLISNYNLVKEGLPLYHCRIAIISVSIGLITNKKSLMKIGSYLGIFGSTSALLFPSMDPFIFPHITQLSFFIGHLFLLWGSIYILFIKKIGMTSKDFKNGLVFVSTYHILMFILNKTIGSNYAYMSSSPIGVGNGLPPLLYALVVITIFNIVLGIEYIIINANDSSEKSTNVLELVS